MAYKKKYTKKKTSGWQDAKTVGKIAWKHKGTAVKALALASKVARMVNVEYKAYEVNIASNITTGGGIYNMTQIEIGNGDAERQGISVKPIRIAGRCYVDMNDTISTTLFRMIIFRGKYERGVAYSIAGSGQYALLDADQQPTLARKNRDNRFGTKILYDKLLTLSASGTRAKVFNVNVKLFGHTNYVAGGTGNDVDDGGVYMILVSDRATLAPKFTAQLTTTYVDN